MTVQEKMLSFCQDIIDDIRLKISQSNDDSESDVLLTTYSDKCKNILGKIKDSDKDLKEDLLSILRDISQLVLDVTYVEEIELVEDDFSKESAETNIQSILDSLGSLEDLAKSVCPEEEVVTSLGAEIVECLRWRKGALLYMYCHTLHHQNPDQGIPSQHHHYLENGVDYLVSMIKTRGKAQWIDSPQDIMDDEDTLQLIEQGIFSDTHLLALMYCGEMCYWHALSCRQSSPSPKFSDKSARDVETKDQLIFHGSFLDTSLEGACPEKIKSEKKFQKSAGLSDSLTVTPEKNCENLSSCVGSPERLQCETLNENNCNQHNQASNLSCKDSSQNVSNVEKMVCIGNSCLKKYISLSKGLLSFAGWSTEKAEDIVASFETLKI